MLHLTQPLPLPARSLRPIVDFVSHFTRHMSGQEAVDKPLESQSFPIELQAKNFARLKRGDGAWTNVFYDYCNRRWICQWV